MVGTVVWVAVNVEIVQTDVKPVTEGLDWVWSVDANQRSFVWMYSRVDLTVSGYE